MGNFEIVDDNQLTGGFRLTAATGYTPDAAEQAYINAIGRVMARMKRDQSQDPEGLDADAATRRERRRERRTKALTELRTEAQQVIDGGLAADLAADNVFTIRGEYLADQRRIYSRLFMVEPVSNHGRITDVKVVVADDVPASQDPSADEKRNLYVALDSSRTVVNTVASRLEERSNRWWRKQSAREAEFEKAAQLRDHYMAKLVEIGRLGLEGPHVELGKLALTGFKGEFVSQEAGRIKNTYIRSLGIAAGIAAAIFLLAYAIVVYAAGATSFWMLHRDFLLAAAGAAVGTWLSFSLRRVVLGFDDLATLEEDRLDPSVRVIFVVLLTMVVCLLFWTDAMNIEIGNLQTGDLGNPSTDLPMGSISLLIGAFCGIAERALATAVSGRATGFVGTLNS